MPCALRRRTGRRPLVPTLSVNSNSMRTLELKIPPPVVAALTAAAMWAISLAGPILPIASSLRLIVVAALIALGITCDLLGLLAFRRSRTTTNPMKPGNTSTLVTAGIYKVTRNPMYLGLVLLLSAWAFHLSAAWSFLGPVLFILYINRFQIDPEERVMRGKFGEEYAGYISRVRRWI